MITGIYKSPFPQNGSLPLWGRAGVGLMDRRTVIIQ